MKKIIFLLLICFIKLNAYNYDYLYRNINNIQKCYFTNEIGGILRINVVNQNNNYTRDISISEFASIRSSVSTLKDVENGNNSNVILGNKYFKEIYLNDLQFLNDLFTSNLVGFKQGFLNYLYNDSNFSNSNYIEYNEVQILYNSDGLAVEAIIGGVWKGFYETPENSGYLYDRDNNILYRNGEVASLFSRFWYALTGNVSSTLKIYYISMLSLNVFILIIAVYLVKVLLGLIIKWITTVINNTRVNVNLGAQKRW